MTRALVVGAGIGGLATARALTRADVSVEVIERAAAWEGAGTGMYLPGNAARALRALDLDGAVADRAVEIPRQRISDHRGRLLVDVDVADVWRGVGPCRALHRGDLHGVLLDGANGVPLRMGVGVRAVHERTSLVVVDFDDGSAGEYDLVIGADGIHSSVRRIVFDRAATARPVGQVGWRFVTDGPAEITTWSLLLGPRTAFLAMPIGHGHLYCYCDVPSSASIQDRRDEPGRFFSGFAPPVSDLVAAAPRQELVHRSVIEEVALDSWVRGRVVLIGDAAHATSPNMAEGAAMALEDAIVLSECLRQPVSIPAALSAFVARRRPRTDWVLEQTHRRDRTRTLPSGVRNAILRAFGARIFRSNCRLLLEGA